MERALIYCRVSTREQAESGLSLGLQEERCRAYCMMRGFEVGEVLVDPGVSGSTRLAQRPSGARVVELTSGRRPACRQVVLLKLDRGFRNAADALSVTEEWNRRGVALHLVDMGGAALDTSSSMGRMFVTMLAGFAAFELAQITERTSAGRETKRARGGYCGGIAPFGFRLKEGKLVEVPAEQVALRLILELRAGGMSFAQIARALESKQVQNRGQGRWTKGRVYTLWRRHRRSA